MPWRQSWLKLDNSMDERKKGRYVPQRLDGENAILYDQAEMKRRMLTSLVS